MQPDIYVFNSDVTKEEDTAVLRKQVEEITKGRLDVLVNNAYENILRLKAHILTSSLRTIRGICRIHQSVISQAAHDSSGYTMTAADTDVQEVEKMFAVNVFGPMRMVRFFHRMLVAAKGNIVNIGSVGGIVPYIFGGTYRICKSL